MIVVITNTISAVNLYPLNSKQAKKLVNPGSYRRLRIKAMRRCRRFKKILHRAERILVFIPL